VLASEVALWFEHALAIASTVLRIASETTEEARSSRRAAPVRERK
jgi:hypothetical protein